MKIIKVLLFRYNHIILTNIFYSYNLYFYFHEFIYYYCYFLHYFNFIHEMLFVIANFNQFITIIIYLIITKAINILLKNRKQIHLFRKFIE